MNRNLGERFNEISQELAAIQKMAVEQKDVETLQRRVTTLQVEQAEMQQTMRFTALFHLRDEAWRALSHGTGS